MTLLAKTAVAAAPYGIDKPYDYRVPEELEGKVLPGVRVMVPFGRGNRLSEAVVLLMMEGEAPRGSKTIASVLDESPVLTEDGVALASFLRQRCYCTMFEAVRTILPAGLWFRRTERCALVEGLDEAEAIQKAGKTPLGAELVRALTARGGGADLAELQRELGEGVDAAAAALRKKGVLTVEAGAKRRLQDKTHRLAELDCPAEEAEAEAERRERKSPGRAAVLRFLLTAGKTSLHELCYQTGASPRTVEALAKAGLIRLTEEEVFRVPEPADLPPAAPITLNEEQRRAYDHLLPHLDTRKPAAALLEGVTGSGKTEVYLQLVQACLDRGRSAMVLVPEIILTPGMMRRFAAYFGSKVVMLHSALRMSERYDQWKRLRQGGPWVVLGTRSAVFSPLSDLGLLILDEEQDGSYQSETVPCYHTRDVAKFLCARQGALLLLGSATPAIESAYAARQGVYQHELLRNRYNQRSLPQVEIADLRQEIRNGNPGSLSAPLRRELERNLESGEQSILFLNRRGSSRMLLCGEC
ncbi:MAG: primosomal protein N', partial [Dysosmobacter sp.]|nr:primosomal protein N' [Dysosmobacter sp.]